MAYASMRRSEPTMASPCTSVSSVSSDGLSCQKGPQLLFAVAGEELAQRLASLAALFEAVQQALDGVRHVGGHAAIADRARDRGVRAEAAADAEVVRVDELRSDFDLLS